MRLAQREMNTPLSFVDEMAFRQWLKDKNVPFQPDAGLTDYDMRGFWRGLQQQDPRAVSGINPNDQRMHYSDAWKTPLHRSFSAGSQWAPPGAPDWINDYQLVSPGGRVMFDEKAKPGPFDGPAELGPFDYFSGIGP